MEKIEKILIKHLELFCFIASFIMAGSHLYQYFDSGKNIYPLLKFIFCTLFCIFIFILKRKMIIWAFLLYAYLLIYFNKFDNYTSFFMITIFVFYRPKLIIPVMTLYIINICAICQINHRYVTHLIIHFINCFTFFFFTHILLWKIVHRFELQLTDSEIYILNELAAGKQQKEIDRYNKNTITKKINEAMKRNNCKSTEELKMKFMFSKFNKTSSIL